MRLLAISAAALSLLATTGATPAAAQGESVLFDHFKTLCAEGEGAGPRALDMARAAGWAPVPDTMFAGADTPFDDITVLMNAEDNGDASLLVVGSVEQMVEGTVFSMTVCATLGTNFETGQPVKPHPGPLIRRWLGTDPYAPMSAGGMTAYAFTLRDGATASPITSETAFVQQMLNKRLHVVMVSAEEKPEGSTLVMYLRPAA